MRFLCEELLSGKFYIFVAGTLGRHLSHARSELCTTVADGMLPAMLWGPTALHGDSQSLSPWPQVLWLGHSIVVKALPGSLHVHAPLSIPGFCPT